MCEKCGKFDKSNNNYVVPLGSIFVEMCKQRAIEEGAVLATLVKTSETNESER